MNNLDKAIARLERKKKKLKCVGCRDKLDLKIEKLRRKYGEETGKSNEM